MTYRSFQSGSGRAANQPKNCRSDAPGVGATAAFNRFHDGDTHTWRPTESRSLPREATYIMSGCVQVSRTPALTKRATSSTRRFKWQAVSAGVCGASIIFSPSCGGEPVDVIMPSVSIIGVGSSRNSWPSPQDEVARQGGRKSMSASRPCRSKLRASRSAEPYKDLPAPPLLFLS